MCSVGQVQVLQKLWPWCWAQWWRMWGIFWMNIMFFGGPFLTIFGHFSDIKVWCLDQVLQKLRPWCWVQWRRMWGTWWKYWNGGNPQTWDWKKNKIKKNNNFEKRTKKHTFPGPSTHPYWTQLYATCARSPEKNWNQLNIRRSAWKKHHKNGKILGYA